MLLRAVWQSELDVEVMIPFEEISDGLLRKYVRIRMQLACWHSKHAGSRNTCDQGVTFRLDPFSHMGRALPSHRADRRRCRSGKTGIARSLNASWLGAGAAVAGLVIRGRSLSATLGDMEVVSCPSIVWKAVMSGYRGACLCSHAEELSCPWPVNST